jgi:hypothetical protein
MNEIQSRVAGTFSGYQGGAVFHLTNGQTWQQRRYRYKYKYKYRPHVRVYEEQGRKMMAFDCMDEPIEVVRVNVLEDGIIVSDFGGFDGNSQFEFDNGHVWKQAEYKYSYHYAYRPHAIIIDGIGGVTLHVEDMTDEVLVRRV